MKADVKPYQKVTQFELIILDAKDVPYCGNKLVGHALLPTRVQCSLFKTSRTEHVVFWQAVLLHGPSYV